MAQGGFKSKSGNNPNSKKASGRTTNAKQKQKNKKSINKGWKTYAAKGRKASQAKQETATSKAINKKNEITVAARAVGAGNTFYLKDIKEAGKKEIGKQRSQLHKRESNSKMSERLQTQLNKLK